MKYDAKHQNENMFSSLRYEIKMVKNNDMLSKIYA